ncbi:AGE family epimerase/isomerase [Actinospica sp. MGRD01-02]|uniref:AGE family epimerase/isomerase n=1 Tax=Actinospica acidithermotolerans TaxID=2828514 RepID=A0A941ED32_9ACTN|nr:AGE family epimerase/isomerase [Actinospica acidithermotolerans]MBR7830525.1 AGE family epimerase/isomerase [Actinospica acidithermotolerans]
MAGEPTRSDLVAGRVERRDGSRAVVRTPGGRPITIHLTDVTYAQRLRNLGDGYRDATGRIDELLVPGAYVFSYGPVYPEEPESRHQATALLFVSEPDRLPPFHEPGWWTEQLRRLARFYRHSQFGERAPDFADYRTEIHSSGGKTGRHVQETDTISRFVYGMASAFMLTGEDDFLDVAEAGSRYLQDHLRFEDLADGVVYWYHGVDVEGPRERRLFASEFGDDYRAIPAYEQIYALVGLVQTYRLSRDPALLRDIEGTVRLFERFFADERLGGYYSHIDPVSMSPHDDALGPNRSRKNWNSVGDHAPAYLINLYLATGDERYRRMLEHTFDMIATHLPDRTEQASPFVFERFHGDWTPDRTWGWQQDRAVVGHNLKIVWNLMRMHAALPKVEYRAHAERIGAVMPGVGRDPQRGGWYDMVQRVARDGRHDFPWHDRKTWWQQEQAILAYLILAGTVGGETALRHADESMAFYNAFFLDHDEGAVHFTVTADGLPYHVGDERLKGSHAMSMYHKAELCFLAEVYLRLLVHGDPLDLWFRPRGDAEDRGRVLRVAPDLLPPDRVELEAVWIDGAPHHDFDARELSVRLPDSAERMKVKVRLRPIGGAR